MNYAKSFNKPVVIICGRKEIKDSHPSVPSKRSLLKFLICTVYDLLSMFPVEVSMTQTKSCLEQLIMKNSPKFPVVERLTSKL